MHPVTDTLAPPDLISPAPPDAYSIGRVDERVANVEWLRARAERLRRVGDIHWAAAAAAFADDIERGAQA